MRRINYQVFGAKTKSKADMIEQPQYPTITQ